MLCSCGVNVGLLLGPAPEAYTDIIHIKFYSYWLNSDVCHLLLYTAVLIVLFASACYRLYTRRQYKEECVICCCIQLCSLCCMLVRAIGCTLGASTKRSVSFVVVYSCAYCVVC